MENRRILINKLRLSIIFPFFDFKEVKKIFRYADSRRKKEKRRRRGASYYPREEGRSLASVCGARKCCLSRKTLPVVFRFELFRRKIGIPCVILYCPDTGYREREGGRGGGLIMRNTYSQTQSCDTRNAGGIRGFLQPDN